MKAMFAYSILSLSAGAHAFGQSYFNNNSASTAGLTNVQCDGTESSWVGCQYSENPTCDSTGFAGVRCSGEVGSCEAAGYTECCTFGCNAGGCFCDQICHTFGDCCEDIQKLCPTICKHNHYSSCMMFIIIHVF